MAKLTNKEYKEARANAENAPELFTFEKFCSNGWTGYYSRYVSPEALKELRQEYKEIKAFGGFELKGFGNRAVIIPTEHGFVLQSYYTEFGEVIQIRLIGWLTFYYRIVYDKKLLKEENDNGTTSRRPQTP